MRLFVQLELIDIKRQLINKTRDVLSGTITARDSPDDQENFHTFLPGLFSSLLLQVQLADRLAVLLQELVVDQHRVGAHGQRGHGAQPLALGGHQALSVPDVSTVTLEALQHRAALDRPLQVVLTGKGQRRPLLAEEGLGGSFQVGQEGAGLRQARGAPQGRVLLQCAHPVPPLHAILVLGGRRR